MDDIQIMGSRQFTTSSSPKDRYEGSPLLLGERTGEGAYYHANGDKYVGT